MKGIYSLDMVKKPRPVAPSAAAFHPKKGVGGGGGFCVKSVFEKEETPLFTQRRPPAAEQAPAQTRRDDAFSDSQKNAGRDEGRMESGNERRTERREFVREGKSKAVSKGGIFVAAVGPGGIMESVLFSFFQFEMTACVPSHQASFRLGSASK